MFKLVIVLSTVAAGFALRGHSEEPAMPKTAQEWVDFVCVPQHEPVVKAALRCEKELMPVGYDIDGQCFRETYGDVQVDPLVALCAFVFHTAT